MDSLERASSLEASRRDFLQALVGEFELTRAGAGVHLQITLRGSTQALWHRDERAALAAGNPRFAELAARYQQELDAFLVGGRGTSYRFHDPGFPLRYGSGGALAVLRRPQGDACCLFQREVAPVGWNLANGGCDSLDELLDPGRTIERELSEELLVIDPGRRQQLVLAPRRQGRLAPTEDGPALAHWRSVLAPDAARLERREVPVSWIDGPDAVSVRWGNVEHTTADVFVSITALDSAIEVDRVARLELDDGAVLCDGEVQQGAVLDRAIGVFDVAALQRSLAQGARAFVPEIAYRGGRVHAGAADAGAPALDLCPVTRQLLSRWDPRAV